jgi:hypothetical protein
MYRTLILLGASAIALGAMIGGVEAKKVYYKIDGKRYWYDTNNRAQAAAARKRMAAAKAAAAAKAKAEAEREKYPLVKLFGSPTQWEAEKAEDQVEKLTAGKEEFLAVSRGSRTEKPVRSERRDRDVKSTGSIAVATVGAASAASAKETPSAPSQEAHVRVATASGEMYAPAYSQPVQAGSQPQVKSVVFDVASGIKTTFMTDGSIREELFDTGTLSKLVSENDDPNSLTAFVNMVRKTPSVEATGATATTPTLAKPY